MKKLKIKFGLIYLILVLTHSCGLFDGKKDDLKNVQINPAYEMNPPIAEDVLVQKIEGDENHMLIIAKYSKQIFKEKYLAIDNDGEKLVLRDDGKGDDAEANDGLFTVKIETDVKQFEEIALKNDKLMESGKRFTFVGRSIITDSVRENFNQKDFSVSRLVSIKGLYTLASDNLKDHSLMITNLGIVEHPNNTWNYCTQLGNIDGAWTFKTLMKHLASSNPASLVSDIELSNFVRN
ncbi:MAG: hypothetical protein H7Y00_07450, partial [Fimbriimonadaceae bacterium]|nr:hypothetical protein [Chitinophagales bacterium]